MADNTLKNLIAQMLMSYVQPNPYMTRQGWEPVAQNGVGMNTLRQVGQNYLDGLRNNVSGLGYYLKGTPDFGYAGNSMY